MKSAMPNVLVALLLSNPAGQRKLAGIFEHFGVSRRWNLILLRTQEEVSSFFQSRNSPAKLDGAIVSVQYEPALFRNLASLKCPLVVMESEAAELSTRTTGLALIHNDSDAIADAALKHFASCGNFKSYAFVETREKREWSHRRAEALRSSLAKNGLPLRVYPASGDEVEKDLPRLSRFLLSLDFPSAVLAANDARAAEVLAAAKLTGVSVPGYISLLGVDDDPWICDAVEPGISSVEPDFHAEGKAAAALLDAMMRGGGSRKGIRHALFGVRRVVARQSTPYLPPGEAVIARAKAFIAMHSADGITPADVAAHLGVSRSLLDLRFRETQKTTVGRLIAEAQLAEVARRLRETKIPLATIHELCGFTNANSLKNRFKARYGVSMREYRSVSRKTLK